MPGRKPVIFRMQICESSIPVCHHGPSRNELNESGEAFRAQLGPWSSPSSLARVGKVF